MNDERLTILEARTEEVPEFFKFTKQLIMNPCPGMANLTYDPFPNAKPDDVVRTEIVARKLILRAKLKGPSGSLTTNNSVTYQGRNFAPTEIVENFGQGDESTFEFEGFALLTPCDIPRALSQLRIRGGTDESATVIVFAAACP